MYFLWKLFDFSFFVDAHRLLKFYKFFVIRHRNKLTSTYNYQARQLTLQANDCFLFFHLNESEKERQMLKSVKDVIVLKLFWRISLENHLFSKWVPHV